MEKVSVVVPVYNSDKTIIRCCNSILEQTYPDIELILVDDGSTDQSAIICDSIAKRDKRVKVIHKTNGGVSSARNCGIDATNGDFLMFVDSDDWLEPYTIQIMVSLVNDAGSDIGAFSFANHINEKMFFLQLDDTVLSIHELLSSYGSVKNIDAIMCSVCNKVYRMSIVKSCDVRFSVNVPFGEDFIFNSKVFQLSSFIATTSQLLYHYDCSVEDSGVKKLYNNYDEYIIFMEKALFDLCNKKGIEGASYKEFKEAFIGGRWKYAFDVCLSSEKSKEEKVFLLTKWLRIIPKDASKWEPLKNSKYCRLVSESSQMTSFEKNVREEIIHIIRINERKRRITRIKIIIKRLLHL